MATNREVTPNSFPKLKLTGDTAESWRVWNTQFSIAAEMAVLDMGTEQVGENRLPKFRGRRKILALFSAIGNEGMETLQSLGFALDSNTDEEFDRALGLLRTHYAREDSFFVKTIRFVTVSQTEGKRTMSTC